MLLDSLGYLFFLFVVWSISLSLNARYTKFLLISASILFYSFIGPWHLLLLLTMIVVNYGLSFQIPKSKNWLIFSIILNVSVLFLVKSLKLSSTWQATSANTPLAPELAENASALFPVGVSFYVLQILSYHIDIYFKKIQIKKSFLEFSFYISFFAQIISGPVERAQSFFAQSETLKPVSKLNLNALILIFWGLVKKNVISDRIFTIVAPLYTLNGDETGNSLYNIVALHIMFIPVYLDLSAYTDIARGSARLFGIKLSKNFDLPLLSTNFAQFWSKMHMTVSHWFKDYVFYTLAFLFPSRTAMFFILFLSFGLCGIWHGLGANFLLWGVLNALVIIIRQGVIKLTPNAYSKIANPKLKYLYYLTNYSLFSIIGIFFTSRDISHALADLSSMVNFEIRSNEIWSVIPLTNLDYIYILIFAGLSIWKNFYGLEKLFKSKIEKSLVLISLVLVWIFFQYEARNMFNYTVF